MQLQNSPSARLRAWRIKQREYKTKIKEHELEKHANQNHRKTTEFHEFSLVRGVNAFITNDVRANETDVKRR